MQFFSRKPSILYKQDLTTDLYSAKVTAYMNGKGAADGISASFCRYFYILNFFTVKENAI